jgi:hypothetical protein
MTFGVRYPDGARLLADIRQIPAFSRPNSVGSSGSGASNRPPGGIHRCGGHKCNAAKNTPHAATSQIIKRTISRR